MSQSRRMTRRLLLAGAPALAVSACGGNLLGPPEPGPIYTLRPRFPAATGSAGVTWALAVARPDMSGSLDSDRIALIQADGTMDYYANATYPDTLSATIQRALVDGFESSGRIAAVGREQDALHADYSLVTAVKDFQARYDAPDTAPGVLVTITAKLVTARGRKVVANFTTAQTAKAQVNSTSAVTEAMTEALGAAVTAIVAWALAAPPPVPG